MRAALIKERMESGAWTPPWLRHQHVARYEWAREHCRGKRVLDAACGNGYGSEVLNQVGAVISLDIAPAAVADAMRSRPETLRLVLGDMTCLPFSDSTFEGVISFETIEHVADDRAYVAEVRRILRRDGIFICSTPNRVLVNPGNSIEDRPFNQFHVREYAAQELQSLLRTAFSEVTMMGQTSFSARYARMLRAIGSLSARTAVRLHQLRKVAGIPFEHRHRHEPRQFAAGAELEVLIAICR